ncbi:MAG: KOW domain-containing RNA-binding protein [Clostridia bacterium]|nr:KOW domain-containing RNA-binding protein [Clostridia bacterium]
MATPRGPAPVLALSTAGHDAGRFYLILSEDGDAVTLADGKHRKLSQPKRKNKKHVKRILDPSGREILYDGPVLTDRYVRKWLNRFRNGDPAAHGEEELF